MYSTRHKLHAAAGRSDAHCSAFAAPAAGARTRTLRCASSSALVSMALSMGRSSMRNALIRPLMRSPPKMRNRLSCQGVGGGGLPGGRGGGGGTFESVKQGAGGRERGKEAKVRAGGIAGHCGASPLNRMSPPPPQPPPHLERQEVAGGAEVTLAPRPPPQLVVDAARLMALAAHDVQPAQRLHLGLLCVRHRLVLALHPQERGAELNSGDEEERGSGRGPGRRQCSEQQAGGRASRRGEPSREYGISEIVPQLPHLLDDGVVGRRLLAGKGQPVLRLQLVQLALAPARDRRLDRVCRPAAAAAGLRQVG